jgi:hypothetical protein
MFDQLHTGPDCGPVTPQMAAAARSKMTRRNLQLRRTPTREKEALVSDDETPLFCAVRAELRAATA